MNLPEDVGTVIVVPVMVKEGEDTSKLKKRLYEMTDFGHVYLINQGKFLDMGDSKLFVQHLEKPAGIWGALHVAYEALSRDPALDSINGWVDNIVLNLAPLYFSNVAVEQVRSTLINNSAFHVVGAREDIAGSLTSDPAVGKARAMAECFLTELASIRLGFPDYMFRDGFSGLHAMTRVRYFYSHWDWVKKTTWGGALQSQIQTLLMKNREESGFWWTSIPHTEERTWDSSLGADMSAVLSMLDQARKLPVFLKISKQQTKEAIENFSIDFRDQPWMPNDPENAANEIKSILSFYNERSTLGPFLEV